MNLENLKGVLVVIVALSFIILFINVMILLISENITYVRIGGVLSFLILLILINAIIDLSKAERRFFEHGTTG